MVKVQPFDVRSDIEICPENGYQIRLTLHEPVDLSNEDLAKEALFGKVAHLWGRSPSSMLPSLEGQPARVTIVLEEAACLPTGELMAVLDGLHRSIRTERPDVPFVVTVASLSLGQRTMRLFHKPYFVLPSAN